MSVATPALMAAAAGVGIGHAILPDHWVPLAVVGRTQHYAPARVARLSAAAGVAHVLVSIVLGALVIVVGLQFRSVVEGVQDTIVGGVLILTGLGFAALQLTGRGHSHAPGDERGHSHGPAQGAAHEHADHAHGHHHHEAHGPEHGVAPHAHSESAVRGRRLDDLAALVIPFGAAASPDLTILPVFLAATTAGVFAAVGALVVFSLATITTIVGLTLLACFGGYQFGGAWLDRWGNILTAGTLLVIGALILMHIL
jgi:nickel/cobalt exporter